MLRIKAFLALVLATGLPAWGQNKVAIELVPTVDSVRAGESFEVAVRFTMPFGWHMYWLNPGDSGMPPTIEWATPPGVSVGKPRFPVPERIKVPGGLVSYGFHRELVLLVPVTTSAGGQDSFNLSATIKSFVCKDVCLIENAQAAVTVAVGETKARQDPRLVDWKAKLPRRVTDEVKQRIEWSDDAKRGVLNVEYAAKAPAVKDMGEKASGGSIEFFAPATEFAVFEEAQITTADNGDIRMSVPFRIIQKQSAPVSAAAILAFTDATSGKRSGIEFDVKFSFPQ
ncbi:MAG: hypothetical protein H7144_15495 [Burkholderiales bacterium]|nr:hypothetical protein [Phycisphaerae bacterium]